MSKDIDMVDNIISSLKVFKSEHPISASFIQEQIDYMEEQRLLFKCAEADFKGISDMARIAKEQAEFVAKRDKGRREKNENKD
jgi:hypothetical protein